MSNDKDTQQKEEFAKKGNSAKSRKIVPQMQKHARFCGLSLLIKMMSIPMCRCAQCWVVIF